MPKFHNYQLQVTEYEDGTFIVDATGNMVIGTIEDGDLYQALFRLAQRIASDVRFSSVSKAPRTEFNNGDPVCGWLYKGRVYGTYVGSSFDSKMAVRLYNTDDVVLVERDKLVHLRPWS